MEPRISVDDTRVLAALERLRGLSGGRALPVMQDVARYMKTSTQLRFRTQRGPDGRTWWPSQRVHKKGGQTLRLTNRLFRSLTWRAGHNFAESGTGVIYAAPHQFGVRKVVSIKPHRRMTRTTDRDRRTVSVKSRPVRGHHRMMFLPARPFAGFSQADRVEILLILREGIEALARK